VGDKKNKEVAKNEEEKKERRENWKEKERAST
jgi:hypothetical protein